MRNWISVEILLTALVVASACGPAETGAVCIAPDPEPTVTETRKQALRAFSEERRFIDDVVGVALSHPASWIVTPDERRFETYGFMLRGIDDDPHDAHGALPIARIAIDWSRSSTDLDAVVQAKIDEYPGVQMIEREIDLGGRRAVVLGPVPGGQVSTNVYFAVDDRLYRINYYGEDLDQFGVRLIESLEFSTPARTVSSLDLPAEASNPAIASIGRGLSPASTDECELAVSIDAARAAEQQLSNGCWSQPSSLFIQTTHSRDANGTGWSRMGTPNFWGDNTHGNWGLGRCTSGVYTNDLYAIDYYLDVGDRLFSPFAAGTVRYAGWDPENWWNYGNMVVISSPSGKYWSLSAHLSAINVVPGQSVDENTLIGWAGSTGFAAPYPHVHQVFYRWPSSSFGRPYGGQGLKQTHLSYLGDGGGVYHSFFKGKWASW